VLREAMKGKMAEGIRTRKHKIGIGSPVEHWFKTDLKTWALDLLHSQSYRQNQYTIDSAFIENLENAYANNTVNKELVHKAWQEINLHIIK
jgi:hypothetical protein